MQAEDRQTKTKAKILRWRGVLAESDRVPRWMVALVLVAASIVFTFTQLGFVGITLPDGTSAYIVVLLLIVALGSLLLGTLEGTLLGLVAGTVLYLHAQYLPLDHYELSFVTPLTSIVMLAGSGLLLGILFALVLRKNPPQMRRVVGIAVVSVVVSWLYSVGFIFNVFVAFAVSIAETVGADVSQEVVNQLAITTVSRLGNLEVQAWATAFFMALVCCAGDYFARKVKERREKGALGLRALFGVWLSVIVALAFMAMAAVSFAAATIDELHDAEEHMQGEVGYLHNQIQASDERARLLGEALQQGAFDYGKVDEALLDDLADILDTDLLLEGYVPSEDGIIIVTIGDRVYLSNDARLTLGMPLDAVFAPDALEAIERSKQTGTMQRFVFEESPATASLAENGDAADGGLGSQYYLAYLYVEDAPGIVSAADDEYSSFEQIIIMIQSSDQVFAKRSSVMTWMTLSSLVLMLVVFVGVAFLLYHVVVRRIDETNGVLEQITQGNLDERVDIRDTREFASLSDGINTTVVALKGWIAEAEERMDAELATAQAIQESALPRIFPPFPDIQRFDVYASMNAAREVGGDFYDFFLVGDDCDGKQGKLAFVVADVSGKGVPAALFMMKAKTQIRDYLSSGMELGEAMTEANRQLCEGNGENMFVTAWVGVLDYGAGRVEYVNAGHNPPLLWQRDGGWRWMRQKSGPMLGLFETTYRAHAVECKAGDMFLLYTDGVTEAFDVDEQLYGEARLFAVAEESYRLHPRELLQAVSRDVAIWSEGAEQSDDITMLALEVGVPPEVTATIEVPADIGELERVNRFLHAELDKRLCPKRAQNQLDIAVEELFVNVCKYAYAQAGPDVPRIVRIQRTYSAEPPSIRVDIIDDGVAFDPLAKPDAVTPKNIEDVPIGGLGILMAKRATDEMSYERVDGSNIVTIVKKW